MKLLDFKANNKSYCIVKLDNYNFSIREYLPELKEIHTNGKLIVTEFKPPLGFINPLEYALRKAFFMMGKDYIPKEKLKLFTLSNDSTKSIFDFKAYEINVNNVDEVRKLIKKVMEDEK